MRSIRSIIAVCLLSFPCWAAEPDQQILDVVRRTRSTTAHTNARDDRQLNQAESLFRKMFRESTVAAELAHDWNALGFELVVEALSEDDVIWIALENRRRLSGRGVYAVRRNALDRLVIQAPHGFFDRHTREIAARLLTHREIAAAAWNTVHRSKVDVAHVERHYFNAFTSALLSERPKALVLQLHGFSKQGRHSAQGRTADFIVSNGSQLPTETTIAMTRQLQANFPHAIARLYPWNVRELGATTNVQGGLVRSAGSQFLSVEIAPSTRQQLVSKPQVCAKFLKALLAAAE